MTETARYWGRIVAINVAATVLATFAFAGVGWHTPWRHVLESASISFLFSTCCSSLCALALPRLVPLISARFAFPMNWVMIVVALIGFASAGTLLALAVLVPIGYIRSTEAYMAWFVSVLKISIVVTLLFGMFGTALEIMRTRLDETTVALRTKQLEEERARKLAIEAQLASLESRVHPHFLFNTLNSIAELVHDDPAAAERVVGQLASLLRSSLDGASMPLVPLEQEVRVVRDYLEIERVRFGDRLRFDVQVADHLGETLVPRLALQTLVENSVKYAVSSRQAGASILIRATDGGGRVRLDVEDDGPGFDTACTPDGHGLALVRSRLAMTFGDRASLHVESRPGKTLVTLDLPA
jgi:two-component system sensor histidine kinase AlgZ